MSSWREIEHGPNRIRYAPDERVPGGYRVQMLVSGEWFRIHSTVSLRLFGWGFAAGLQSAVTDGVQGELL